MKVKFKPGKFHPQWHVIVRQVFLFYFFRIVIAIGLANGVKIKYKFDDSSRYFIPGRDIEDWLKFFGSRTGTKTGINYELLAAFVFLPELSTFKTCVYINKPDVGEYANREYLYPAIGNKGEQIIAIPYWLPAWSYAGGDVATLTGFEMEVSFGLV